MWPRKKKSGVRLPWPLRQKRSLWEDLAPDAEKRAIGLWAAIMIGAVLSAAYGFPRKTGEEKDKREEEGEEGGEEDQNNQDTPSTTAVAEKRRDQEKQKLQNQRIAVEYNEWQKESIKLGEEKLKPKQHPFFAAVDYTKAEKAVKTAFVQANKDKELDLVAQLLLTKLYLGGEEAMTEYTRVANIGQADFSPFIILSTPDNWNLDLRPTTGLGVGVNGFPPQKSMYEYVRKGALAQYTAHVEDKQMLAISSVVDLGDAQAPSQDIEESDKHNGNFVFDAHKKNAQNLTQKMFLHVSDFEIMASEADIRAWREMMYGQGGFLQGKTNLPHRISTALGIKGQATLSVPETRKNAVRKYITQLQNVSDIITTSGVIQHSICSAQEVVEKLKDATQNFAQRISSDLSDKISDPAYNEKPEFDTKETVTMERAWEETRTVLSSQGLPFVALRYPYTTSLFLLVLHPDFNVPNPDLIGYKNNQIGLEIIQLILKQDTSSLPLLEKQSIQKLRTASRAVVAAMKKVLVTMTATREWLKFQNNNNLDPDEVLVKVVRGAMFLFLNIAEPNLQTIQTVLCKNMDADFAMNLMQKEKERLEQAVLEYGGQEPSEKSQDGEEKAKYDPEEKAEYDEKNNQNIRTLESLKTMLVECSGFSDPSPAPLWAGLLNKPPKSAPIPAQSSLNFLGIMAQLIENDKNSSAQNDSALLPNDEDAWDKVVNQYNSNHKNKLLEIPKGYHNLIIVLMSTLFWVNSLHKLRAKPVQQGQPEEEEVWGATQTIYCKIAELANNIWKGSVRASIIHKNRDDYRAIIPVRVTDRNKTDGGAQMIVVFNAPVYVAYSQLEELFDAKHSTGSLQASLAINPGREAFGSILRPVRNVQWAAGQVAGAMQSLNPYRLKWSKETKRIATNILTSGVGGMLAAGAMYTAASDATPQLYRHIY